MTHKKIAIVTYHFFKTKTRGGETYVYLLAKILKKFADISVITTQSTDHLTWKNSLKSGKEIFNDFLIIRHPIDFSVKPRTITNLTHYLLKNKNHLLKEEENWIRKIGPYSSNLFKYLIKNKNLYDLFFFVGYANPITFFGLPMVKEKAFLIPLTHKEPRLYFKIFDQLFSQPIAILASSYGEIEVIKKRFPNHAPLHLLGIYPSPIDKNFNNNTRKKISLNNHYVLFIGRTEPYKGIYQLIEYFNLFIKKNPIKLNLIIIGEKLFPINTNKNIIYLGAVSQEEKNILIKNSLFLINPSWYESLSLTLLEGWQQKKPSLVYGFNPVLKNQITKSKGGFYYENYQQFEKNLKILLLNKTLRNKLGENGWRFYQKNYSEKVITEKILKIINSF